MIPSMDSRKVPTWAELPYWEVKVSSHEPTITLLASAHSPKAAATGAATRTMSVRARPAALRR